MQLRLSYHSFNKAKAKNCNINKNNNSNNNKDILIIIVKEISRIHREKYIKSLKKKKKGKKKDYIECHKQFTISVLTNTLQQKYYYHYIKNNKKNY